MNSYRFLAHHDPAGDPAFRIIPKKCTLRSYTYVTSNPLTWVQTSTIYFHTVKVTFSAWKEIQVVDFCTHLYGHLHLKVFTRTAVLQSALHNSRSLIICRWHHNFAGSYGARSARFGNSSFPVLNFLITNVFKNFQSRYFFISWGGIPPSVVPVWRSAANQTDLHPIARIKGIG